MWGARLMALPSISWCLGAFDLRPSWGQHTSCGSARLFTAMQYIWHLGVSTLHSFKINIPLWLHHWSFRPLQKTSSSDAPFKILLGILGYWTLFIWGLFEVGMPIRPPRGWPCQTPCHHAGRSRCLCTSFRSRPWPSFLLFLSIKPAMLPPSIARGLLYKSVFDALLISSSYRPVGKPVSRHVITPPTFSSFLFWIIIPAILPAMMLGYYSMSASLTPSEFFHRRFDLLEVCFL
jgi:hypothetical protein